MLSSVPGHLPSSATTSRWEDRHLALAVGLLALAVRGLYLFESRNLPWNRVAIGDGKAYFAWADSIVSGDIWGQSVGVFYQAPLYPYFLALLQVFGLGSPSLVRVVQAVVGAFGCWGLARIGSRWFGRWPGLLAGLLLALSPSAVFLDGSLDKSALAGALTVAFVGLVLPIALSEDATWRDGLAAGSALGMLALTRESTLVWVALPVVAVLPGAGRRASEPKPWARSPWMGFLAGLLLVLGAVGLRNGAVGGSFVATTAQAGPNFYIGNRRGASGSYEPLLVGRGDARFERGDAKSIAEHGVGRMLSDGEVSRWWWRRGFSEIAADPIAAAGGFLHKLRLVVHSYEVPDVDDLELSAEVSPTLLVLCRGFGFGVIVPLAAAGALIGRRRPEARLLVFLVGIFALGTAAFYVLARYRAPLVPLLALLVAAGVRELAREPAARRGSNLALPLALVAATGWMVNQRIPAELPPARALVHANLAAAWIAGGEPGRAEPELRRALAANSNLPEARLMLGSLLFASGAQGEGLEHLEAAVRLAPEDAEAWAQLGRARLQARDRDRAIEALRRALELAPEDPRVTLDLIRARHGS